MEISETDWGLLEKCSQNRETRANLAVLLDVTPNYVSKELGKLTDLGLLEDVGPAEKSGMYVTTCKGDFVLEKRDKYENQHSELFGELIDSSIEVAEQLTGETEERTIDPSDIVITSVDAYDQLHSLQDTETFSLQTAKEASKYDNIYAVYGVLYELNCHNLLARPSSGDEYRITDRGHALLEEPTPATVTVENINRVWNALPYERE
jgi:Mn-dependent DtxR family transcriptional regulator